MKYINNRSFNDTPSTLGLIALRQHHTSGFQKSVSSAVNLQWCHTVFTTLFICRSSGDCAVLPPKAKRCFGMLKDIVPIFSQRCRNAFVGLYVPSLALLCCQCYFVCICNLIAVILDTGFALPSLLCCGILAVLMYIMYSLQKHSSY